MISSVRNGGSVRAKLARTVLIGAVAVGAAAGLAACGDNDSDKMKQSSTMQSTDKMDKMEHSNKMEGDKMDKMEPSEGMEK